MGKNEYLAFVGTNAVRNSKGIYSLRIDAQSLRPTLAFTKWAYNAGSMALSRRRDVFYAAAEGNTFHGRADGGVTAFRFDEDGQIHELGWALASGQRTCSVCVDGGDNAYGASFLAGTWVKWPLAENGAPLAPAYSVASQGAAGERKALHCVCAIGEKYVGVISVSEAALIIFSAEDGRRVTSFSFPGQPFCRYLEVCGDCIYAMMQDPGDIYVFRNHLDEEGTIRHIQTISVQEKKLDFYATTTLRATPDHRLMLAATRAVNTLTVFRILPDGRLERGSIVALPGETPRDFGISRDGRIVVTCLQKSDEVCIHTIDYENATLIDSGYKLSIPSPAAVVVTERR